MTPNPTTTAPTTIGPYRIEREIARGGMGIVYLARDTRLDRAVAIKALPDDFAEDPERLARFEREAKVLASLNHPNIAGIHGIEESEGRRYLALEHVEGETLADRIGRGPLPLYEAIDLSIQIAAGIEAAHEAGVIHRDLKPGNVMITHGDHVKVVDFGLAKGRVSSESGIVDSPTLANSPTLTSSPTFPTSPAIPQSPTIAHSPTYGSPATMPGVILGTAAYLSPEQARGKPVDRRTDIWSFGCVLYECLTGRMAFEGETVSDTIAKILEREVDWSILPPKTPARVRELLRRCLEKDPRKRLRDIGDARITLEEAKSGAAAPAEDAVATPVARPHRRRAAILIAATAILSAAIGLLAGSILQRPGSDASRAVTRLSIALPPDLRVTQAELTPDGRALVIIGQERTAKEGEPARAQLYVRWMDRGTFEPLRGTERAEGFIVSTDGKWIEFTATVSDRTTDEQILKIPIDGSAPPVPIAKKREDWQGRAAWLESGEHLIPVAGGKRYVRLSAKGGPPSEPKPFDSPGFTGSFSFTHPLPGDRGVLLQATSYEGGVYRLSVGVLDLRSDKVKILARDAGSPQYSPTGHLLFTQGEALLAAPFDLGRLELKGPPVALLGGLRVGTSWGNASIQMTPGGTLLHVLGGNVGKDRRAVIVDAGGRVSDWSGERLPFESSIALSKDGNFFAGIVANAGAIYEIWISERGRTASRRVVAVAGVDCGAPVWSPDGSQIAYSQTARQASDGIYLASTDGSGAPRRIVRASADTLMFPDSWSPDGTQLLCTRLVASQPELCVASARGPGEAEAKPVFTGTARRGVGAFSSDGRLIAYISDEAGRTETFICRWDGAGPVGQPVLVSRGGGGSPVWARDGRRLYYPTTQNKVMSVTVEDGARLSASAPTVAWDMDALRIPNQQFSTLLDLLPDGRLLAIQKGEGEDEITRFDVALNFDQEIRGKAR